MKYNFIKTSDKETKENNHSLTFENTNNKIQYSNMLTF